MWGELPPLSSAMGKGRLKGGTFRYCITVSVSSSSRLGESGENESCLRNYEVGMMLGNLLPPPSGKLVALAAPN